MDPIVIALTAIAILLIAVSLAWRRVSSKLTFPCPAWLGWLVERDNPVVRNNSVREILPLLRLSPGMRVLDFGCGPGRLTLPIAQAIAPDGTVTAFDIQAAMLERVRVKAERENLRNIEYLQGAAGAGMLGGERFDRALLVTVLGEVPDKPALLREIFAALKPGGLLVVTETVADPHYQPREKVQNACLAAGFEEQGTYGNRISFSMVLVKPELP